MSKVADFKSSLCGVFFYVINEICCIFIFECKCKKNIIFYSYTTNFINL
jgi:hypothetical protein